MKKILRKFLHEAFALRTHKQAAASEHSKDYAIKNMLNKNSRLVIAAGIFVGAALKNYDTHVGKACKFAQDNCGKTTCNAFLEAKSRLNSIDPIPLLLSYFLRQGFPSR